MNCPEKETLQQRCSAAWNAFESGLASLGVPMDPTIGAVMPRLMQALKHAQNPIDPRTGMLQSPYLDAFALLGEHQKASTTLSAHLHRHRC